MNQAKVISPRRYLELRIKDQVKVISKLKKERKENMNKIAALKMMLHNQCKEYHKGYCHNESCMIRVECIP